MSANTPPAQQDISQSDMLSNADAVHLQQQLEDKNSTIEALQNQIADLKLVSARNLALANENALIERAELQCEIQSLKLNISQIKKGIIQPSVSPPLAPPSNNVEPVTSATADSSTVKLLDATLSTLLSLGTLQQQQASTIASLQSQLEQNKNTISSLEQAVLLAEQNQAQLAALESKVSDAHLLEQKERLLAQQTMNHMEEEIRGLQQELANYQIMELQRYQRLEQQQAQYHQLNQHNVTRLDEAIEDIQQSNSDTALLITQQFAHAIESWNAIHTLLTLSGNDFIQSLSQFALGRMPLDHEIAYFSNQLELGTDKYSILQQFFSSEEHKIWSDSLQLTESQRKFSPAALLQNQLTGDKVSPVASNTSTDDVKKVGIIESILLANKTE
jgi:hypothetical protein